MSATRRTFVCGHRGWGQHCHRCEQATDFDARDATEEGDHAVAATLRDEAIRLRGPQKVLAPPVTFTADEVRAWGNPESEP